ncbi:hypothetical protein GS597_01370 [Synechococcales cyanobacterium C]|uniref:Mor transcription activator domain-containing protein n=1 Tax=Petrachloros mirabilis ULC683 TaxID=2781853 RepID=A0A8K2AGT6_9CYAN|nr:hypothetical protein [Petrachloros mirabilis]NCJ05189.1 hypothetical protein [Petrachloros mirabilis ULC683]
MYKAKDFENIAQAIGRDQTQRLIDENRGKWWIYIPKAPTPRIVEIIGLRASQKLCELYGGDRLRVPSSAKSDAQKNAEICRAVMRGEPAVSVCCRFGLRGDRLLSILRANIGEAEFETLRSEIETCIGYNGLAARHEQIQKRLAAGETITSVARSFGLNPTWVLEIGKRSAKA